MLRNILLNSLSDSGSNNYDASTRELASSSDSCWLGGKKTEICSVFNIVMLSLTVKFSKVVDTQRKEKSRWIFANCGAMLPVVVALAYNVESHICGLHQNPSPYPILLFQYQGGVTWYQVA